MRPDETQSEIRCPTGLLSRHEAQVAELAEAINQAHTAREKAGPAAALVEEMETLLECPASQSGDAGCGLCRKIAELRRRAAALVVQAGELQERRLHTLDDSRRP
jgi:hypothetical protein